MSVPVKMTTVVIGLALVLAVRGAAGASSRFPKQQVEGSTKNASVSATWTTESIRDTVTTMPSEAMGKNTSTTSAWLSASTTTVTSSARPPTTTIGDHGTGTGTSTSTSASSNAHQLLQKKYGQLPKPGSDSGIGAEQGSTLFLNPQLNKALLNKLLTNETSLSSTSTSTLVKKQQQQLQEAPEQREPLLEQSVHQPVIFIGGPGYLPPNNLKQHPLLIHDDLPVLRPFSHWAGGGGAGSGSSSHVPHRPLSSSLPSNYIHTGPSSVSVSGSGTFYNATTSTRVQHITAECADDFMRIQVQFNGSFKGLIYSSGYSHDPDCVYVDGSGASYYEYLIRLNRCGTLGTSNHVEGRKEPSKNFMWNTITVQYSPLIEEEWDEHFKVTCEYGYDFWKTVTFPFLDVEVATGNPLTFTLTPPECYMEIRYGFGTQSTSRVTAPVRVGDPLTLVINMRSEYDGFDLVVNNCYAHNGGNKRIQLIDEWGCPVDNKLISPFRGSWSNNGQLHETQVYAYLKTFRFTGSPALYIECDVRMCHGQCPSQPCYWRNMKSDTATGGTALSRRRRHSNGDIDSQNNTQLSEKMNLFQSLKVLQEQEELDYFKPTVENELCLRPISITIFVGLALLLILFLSSSTLVYYYRLRVLLSNGVDGYCKSSSIDNVYRLGAGSGIGTLFWDHGRSSSVVSSSRK